MPERWCRKTHVAYCDALMSITGSEDDRRQSLDYLKANFRPGGTLERAFAVDV